MFARLLQGFLASQQHPMEEKNELILWISFYQKKKSLGEKRQTTYDVWKKWRKTMVTGAANKILSEGPKNIKVLRTNTRLIF